MTLDERLAAARAEPEPGRATHRFWLALEREIRSCFPHHAYFERRDLTERTLLIVWRKIDRYRQTGPDSLRRWVRVIAAKEARYTRWRAARLVRLESKILHETALSPGLTPSHYVLAIERIELAKRAHRKLAASQRRALDAEDAESLAASERISLDAARMRIHRAIRSLAKLIDDMRKTKPVRIVTPR